MFRPLIRVASIATFLLVDIHAQALVRDINPDIQNRGSNCVVLGNAGPLVYLAPSQSTSRLWRTDGTAAGTVPLAFAEPERPQFLEVGDLDGSGRALLSLSAGGAQPTAQLWVSDGTAAGTVFLTPQTALSMVRAGNEVVFLSDAGGLGYEPWRSDGTVAGTYRLADLSPGAAGCSAYAKARLGNTALYLLTTSSGLVLLRSDATVAGTVIVRRFPTPTLFDQRMVVAGATAYFTADDGVNGFELWRTDGTAAGTAMVRDLAPGGSSSIQELVALGSSVLFTTSFPTFGIWRSDGTAAGTVAISSVLAQGLKVSGGRVFFVGTENATGSELWSSDGTAAGTRLEIDLVPGPNGSILSHLVPLNGGVVMRDVNDAYWSYSGGIAVPLGVVTTMRAGLREITAALPGRALLSAFDPQFGEEPFVTDGTAAGTTILRDLEPTRGDGSYPTSFVGLADTTYFAANAGVSVGASLWRTDGSTAGTSLVTALPGQSVLVHAALDRLFVTGDGVWVSDGSAAGTQQIANLLVPSAGRVLVESPQPGRVLFAAGDATGDVELWESDGTAAGTRRLVDVNPFGSGDVHQLTRLGNLVLFSAVDQHGFEPWVSDGTSAGTQLLVDLVPGAVGSLPQILGVFGSRALFTTFAGVWGTDGTAVGTQLLLPRDVTAFALGDSFALIAWNADVYVTDGTSANTRYALRAPGQVRSLAIADGTIYVGTDDGRGLLELSVVGPGPALAPIARFRETVSGLQFLHQVGTSRHVVFAASSGGSGVDLWTSDGTVAGTRQLVAWNTLQLQPPLHRQLDQLLFVHGDAQTGQELWSMPLRITGAAVAAPRGLGCGAAGRVPQLLPITQPAIGNATFALDVTQARPNTAAALLLGARPARAPVGPCLLYTNPDVALSLQTDALGAARQPLPVPALRALVGLNLFAQAVTLDPAGPLPGGASASGGVHLVVGR